MKILVQDAFNYLISMAISILVILGLWVFWPRVFWVWVFCTATSQVTSECSNFETSVKIKTEEKKLESTENSSKMFVILSQASDILEKVEERAKLGKSAFRVIVMMATQSSNKNHCKLKKKLS